MKSADSLPYYESRAQKLALNEIRSKDPSELLPFLQAIPPGSRVVDLGCGAGLDLQWMRKAGFRAIGLEGSAARVRTARELDPEVEILEKNMLFYTPAEGEWDGVWACRSLHHFAPEATQRVVAALFRGLRRGGIFGIVVFEGQGWVEDRGEELDRPSRHIHLWSERALSSMVEQSGFRVLRVGRKAQRPGAGDPHPSLLILAEKI
jgi:SAM-dependent methyltransferase